MRGDLALRFVSRDHPDAQAMMVRLSTALHQQYGSDGRAGFDATGWEDDRAGFIVAYAAGHPVGCGAVGPCDAVAESAEIKRMYADEPGCGIGLRILTELEGWARDRGYRSIVLETRWANEAGVRFYRRAGYVVRDNYGRYVGRPECVCFAKTINPGDRGDRPE